MPAFISWALPVQGHPRWGKRLQRRLPVPGLILTTSTGSRPTRRFKLQGHMNPDCVISGWMGSSGDALISRFQLIIWLHTPAELRIRRLKARELANFGKRILPGGDMYENHQEFLDYSAQYDDGGMDIRSYARIKEWLEQATCPVMELDGRRTTESLAAEVILKLKEIC